MGTTANYGWPFPDRGFAPDGPAQMQALATAIDASLKTVDATDDAALAAEISNRASAIATEVATRTKAIDSVNAAVHALPFIQARSSIYTTNSAGGGAINFPVAFASTPVVVACSGDHNIGNSVAIIALQVGPTGFGFVAYNTDGTTAASAPFRINWIAFGT